MRRVRPHLGTTNHIIAELLSRVSTSADGLTVYQFSFAQGQSHLRPPACVSCSWFLDPWPWAGLCCCSSAWARGRWQYVCRLGRRIRPGSCPPHQMHHLRPLLRQCRKTACSSVCKKNMSIGSLNFIEMSIVQMAIVWTQATRGKKLLCTSSSSQKWLHHRVATATQA